MTEFKTTERPAERLVIFARYPEPGRVKTRLAQQIGDQRALEVYRSMLADLLDQVGESDERIDVEIAWTSTDPPSGDDLVQTFGLRHLVTQCGHNLGERLIVAFSERIIFHRASKIVAIGSDDPGLDRAAIERAFALLDGCEWVIGPAHDGGYYLIGCRAASFHPSVFEKIDWGTAQVFRETEASIRSLGCTLAVLPRRRDLDREDDLRAFLSSAEGNGGRLRRLLESWEWSA